MARHGEIRVFGHQLPVERARAIRARLRTAEGHTIPKYEEIIDGDKCAGGRIQLRLNINANGQVADIKAIEVDLNNARVGAEAYAFHIMEFRPDPFEVISIRSHFEADHPILVADVLNRTAFHLKNVAAIVRVQAPDKAAPLRVSRVRMRAPFKPGDRRTLRIPVKSEWASDRYTFLLDVRPSSTESEEETE